MTIIAITKPQPSHIDISIHMILDQFEKMDADGDDIERERFKLYSDREYRNSWLDYLAR